MGKEKKTLGQLAQLVGGELCGDPHLAISGVAAFGRAGAGELSFIADHKLVSRLGDCAASALVLPLSVQECPIPSIRVKNPSLAFARIHALFLAEPFVASGISPQASVGQDCHISEEVSVGPLVSIGDRVQIGRRVKIHPGVVLYDDVCLGDDVVLHANVTVYHGCELANRVIVHAGTVIGSDGFGYVADEAGRQVKRPQVGTVRIEDDVEIGANVCIDRATFGTTLIRRGTKLDNLVQLGHNVEIGADSILVAQVGVAGSVSTGTGVVLGGQAGVAGHLHLGDRAMVAAKSGVHSSLKPGEVVAGIPAISHAVWLRASAVYARLPELIKELRALRRQVAAQVGKDDVLGGT